MLSQTPPAFVLPAVLLSQGFSLRSETDDDVPFLMELYASTREEELAQAIDWSAEQKRQFLAMQFQAQRHHYRTRIEGCMFSVLERHGTPVGRLYLETRKDRLQIVEISFLPQCRGAGIGTAILEAVMAIARESGRNVGIFVEKFNPALRLYRRLGFTEIADSGVYLEMEWTIS